MSVPFFKIERNNKIAYVLGTYHYCKLEQLPEFITDIIKDEVKSLVEESVSPSGKPQKTRIEELYRLGVLTRNLDNEWHKKLSSKAIEVLKLHIEKVSKDIGCPAFELNQINPLLAAFFCQLSLQRDGLDWAIEELFKGRCYELDVDSDTDVLFERHKRTIEETEKVLLETGEYHSSAEHKSYLDSYLSGEFFDENHVSEFEMNVDCVVNRNIHWLPKIIKYFEDLPGPVLFAVGTAHLPGMMGVLELLKRCGFKVSAMDANGKFHSYETRVSKASFAPFIDAALANNLSEVVKKFADLQEKNALVIDYLGDLIANDPGILTYHTVKRQKADPDRVECYFEGPEVSVAKVGI